VSRGLTINIRTVDRRLEPASDQNWRS